MTTRRWFSNWICLDLLEMSSAHCMENCSIVVSSSGGKSTGDSQSEMETRMSLNKGTTVDYFSTTMARVLVSEYQSSSGTNPPHATPPPSNPSPHCLMYISSSSWSSHSISDLG